MVSVAGDLPWDKPVKFEKQDDGVWKGRLAKMDEGKIVPMVVVMPNGSIEMPDGNFMGEVPLFAEDMITGIIPFIEDNYRVHADQKYRAMAGLSMGGMETLEVTLNNPELFSYVWVLSASFAPGNKEVYEYERVRLKKEAERYNRNFKILAFTQGGAKRYSLQ